MDETRRRRNRKHWDETLDSANLGRHARRDPLERQLSLYFTADVRAALRWLAPARRVLDLGGGLGLMTILLMRRRHEVILADLSLARLREARAECLAEAADAPVLAVVCEAEHLPFRDGAFDGQFCKSVLIHTDIPRAAAELARTLAPGGRAFLVEPMTRNPLVNLYRRLAAPGAWRDITTYFANAEIAAVRKALRARGHRVGTEGFFLTAFLASVFAFALPAPRLHGLAEGLLLRLDRILFRLRPAWRRRAWFVAISVGRR